MKRLVKMIGGSGHETEMFTNGKNYFVKDNIIEDDANQKHHVVGSELFLYSTGHSFYVYTKDEVRAILEAYEQEIDGLATEEQLAQIALLLSVIDTMGGW